MLNETQRRRFASEGYVVVPAVVPEKLLRSVDREIDAVVGSDPPSRDATGKHFYFLPPDQLPAADNALQESGALGLAEEMTSPHRLVNSYGHIQIALNIPTWEHIPGGPHLDGYHDPDRPHPFTLLVGVFLGDETQPSGGNLWVWPGSHVAHAELFESRGVTALLASDGHSGLLDPPLDLGEPVPVLAERGDVLLAHYLLGHNSGGNTTAMTRRAIYVRLSGEDHERHWDRTLTDPFLEYPTIRPPDA